MSDGFDRDTILDCFAEVANLLERRGVVGGEIVIVGGAYMALAGLRAGTHDVDTVTRIPGAVREAVTVVGERRGLSVEWLNARAAPFAPTSLTVEHVVFDQPALRVVVPSADDIFLMKLNANRTRDRDDLRRLWPRCSFNDATEVVARFYQAYPHEECDDELVAYVTSVVHG